MLLTTAQQLRERQVRGDLGDPIISSSIKDQAIFALAGEILTVPRGQVFLMTSIQIQADSGKQGISTTPNPSPATTGYGIQVNNEAGSTLWAMTFQAFVRQIGDYHSGITPSPISAAPGNAIVWNPKYTIPVPGGCTIEVQGTVGDYGNHAAVHGIMVDEGTAASIGYNVHDTAATSRHGFVTTRGHATATELLAGRPGKCIRILDLHVRIQPESNTTNTLTLRQTDDTNIFRWSNSNVVDTVQQAFSPDEIFLKAGQGLEELVTVASTCSLNIVYEFVDVDEVPANAWWGCVTPSKPTPSSTAFPVATGARTQSSVIPLYYPRLESASGTAGLSPKTVPGVGYQHMVRGVQISAQKGSGTFQNSFQAVEPTLFTISQGSAAGLIQYVPLTAQTNVQIIPVLFLGLHDQNLSFVDDKLNVPCKANTGALWVDTLGFENDGLAGSALTGSVDATDGDITAWSVTVWGRTIATQHKASRNLGD